MPAPAPSSAVGDRFKFGIIHISTHSYMPPHLPLPSRNGAATLEEAEAMMRRGRDSESTGLGSEKFVPKSVREAAAKEADTEVGAGARGRVGVEHAMCGD